MIVVGRWNRLGEEGAKRGSLKHIRKDNSACAEVYKERGRVLVDVDAVGWIAERERGTIRRKTIGPAPAMPIQALLPVIAATKPPQPWERGNVLLPCHFIIPTRYPHTSQMPSTVRPPQPVLYQSPQATVRRPRPPPSHSQSLSHSRFTSLGRWSPLHDMNTEDDKSVLAPSEPAPLVESCPINHACAHEPLPVPGCA